MVTTVSIFPVGGTAQAYDSVTGESLEAELAPANGTLYFSPANWNTNQVGLHDVARGCKLDIVFSC